MADRKIGALIAVENEVSLEPFAERGTPIDAVLTKDLLVSLFFPHSLPARRGGDHPGRQDHGRRLPSPAPGHP